jgi:hypothetical protein
VTFNTRSLLGGALLAQKRHDAAKPLLLKGYDGMKQREAHYPREPQESPDRSDGTAGAALRATGPKDAAAGDGGEAGAA